MFLPREKKIVQMLLKSEKKLTTSQVAADLRVSPRTIKTDIKKINDILERHCCSIQTKQGVGLWLTYSDKTGEAFLRRALYEDEDMYISADVRRYYIATSLLLNNGYTSMEAIANHFFVSKGTVLNDINALESFWKKFDITFIKKVKYGIKTEGTEMQIRLALVDALKKSAGERGEVLSRDRVQQQLGMIHLDDMHEVIQETESRFQFVLTDVSFEEFLIQLAVMAARAGQGDYMPEQEDNFEERRSWFVARFIKERMAEKAAMEIPEQELFYLVTCLQGLRYQVPMIKDKYIDNVYSRSPEMFEYMMSIVRRVDEKYQLNLENDGEFSIALFDHLECMVYRIQSKMYLKNPILESIKKEMFYEYEIASYLLLHFSSKYEIEMTEDEIGYITFHVGTSIERMRQKKKKVMKVVVVCMTGIGTSQFITIKLKRLFPDLKITKIISGKQVKDLSPEDQDFVITTVPLYLEHIDMVQVSPVLNDMDVARIQRYIQKMGATEPEDKTAYSYLKRLVKEEITILNSDLESKEDVIRLLGEKMLGEGYVDEGYVESVFEREKLSETAVGNLIAIPHAFEGHILKQGIGLLTLQKPINWGNTMVQIVFLLTLDAKADINFQGVFSDVLDLTKNIKDAEQILKAKEFHDIEFLDD